MKATITAKGDESVGIPSTSIEVDLFEWDKSPDEIEHVRDILKEMGGRLFDDSVSVIFDFEYLSDEPVFEECNSSDLECAPMSEDELEVALCADSALTDW